MNLSRVAISIMCIALTSLGAIAKTPAIDTSAAPADEYFGPQKMSAIGIRMRIDALGRQYHARTIADSDLIHDASNAEAALRMWNTRYPRDPWLAPAAFHMEQLYAAVQSPEARTHATSLLHFIADTFGATRYGHLSRLRLAQGFPPLHAESPVASPTPAAQAVTSPAASETPPASASPATVASPPTTLPPR